MHNQIARKNPDKYEGLLLPCSPKQATSMIK